MKESTTEYQKWVEAQPNRISTEFLLSIGFEIEMDKPLFTTFKFSGNEKIKCSIGKYGDFGIYKYHWCNPDERDAGFFAINPHLSIEDFKIIVRFMGLTDLLPVLESTPPYK